MATRLTHKQRNFTNEYLGLGNATEATMRAYRPKKRATARAIGSENLTKPNIRAYLEAQAGDAAAMIVTLSRSAKNEAVRFNASRDILDRVGYFVDKTRPSGVVGNLPIPILSRIQPPIYDGRSAIGLYENKAEEELEKIATSKRL